MQSVKNLEEWTHWELNESLMIIRRKMNSVHLPHVRAKTCNGWRKKCSGRGISFLERVCSFSLDFRPFGPSVLDGARSKVVLLGEGYA